MKYDFNDEPEFPLVSGPIVYLLKWHEGWGGRFQETKVAGVFSTRELALEYIEKHEPKRLKDSKGNSLEGKTFHITPLRMRDNKFSLNFKLEDDRL